MKVLCINDGMFGINCASLNNYPVIGKVYTVVDTYTYRGATFYCLEEFPPSEYFLAECFAPISDIDETELVREKELTHA